MPGVLKRGISPGAKMSESPSKRLSVSSSISGTSLGLDSSKSLRKNFMSELYSLKTPVYLPFT
jgi:hypothetical protein